MQLSGSQTWGPSRTGFPIEAQPNRQRCKQRATHGPAQVPKRQGGRAIQSLTRRPGQGGTVPAFDPGLSLRPECLLRSPAHLRTASPTGRPGPNTASGFDPCLRPEMRQTPAHCSSLTGVIKADWDQPTRDACSVRTRKWMEKVR